MWRQSFILYTRDMGKENIKGVDWLGMFFEPPVLDHRHDWLLVVYEKRREERVAERATFEMRDTALASSEDVAYGYERG